MAGGRALLEIALKVLAAAPKEGGPLKLNCGVAFPAALAVDRAAGTAPNAGGIETTVGAGTAGAGTAGAGWAVNTGAC